MTCRTAHAHAPAGRLTEKWLPNGVNTRYQYNLDNTLTQVLNRNPSGATVSQHDYSYNQKGQTEAYPFPQTRG